MNVLVPISFGLERPRGETHYTSIPWKQLDSTQQAIHMVKICHALGGEKLEFTIDELSALQDAGALNEFYSKAATKSFKSIPMFWANVRSVTTQSYPDPETPGTIKIRLLAHPKQDSSPAFPDNTAIGTIFAEQIPSIINKSS